MIDECFETVEPLLGTAIACVATGRARATVYRRRRGRRVTVKRPRRSPPNKLTDAGLGEILATLRSPRFVDCSPAQVYFTLLDEGVYLASESSLYRVLRATTRPGSAAARRRTRRGPAPSSSLTDPLRCGAGTSPSSVGRSEASTTTSTW